MGEYTSKYNLYLPSLGEQGWGSLVNQNFVLIDQNLPIVANDGSKWFVNNAFYNKNTDTWTQTDVNKASTAVHLAASGIVEMLMCAAGNASIIWSTALITGILSGNSKVDGDLVVTGQLSATHISVNTDLTTATGVIHISNPDLPYPSFEIPEINAEISQRTWYYSDVITLPDNMVNLSNYTITAVIYNTYGVTTTADLYIYAVKDDENVEIFYYQTFGTSQTPKNLDFNVPDNLIGCPMIFALYYNVNGNIPNHRAYLKNVKLSGGYGTPNAIILT